MRENPAPAINRISPEASCAIFDTSEIIAIFNQWVEWADYVVAHNAAFDKQWFGQAKLPSIDKPWLCTYDDFIWDKNPKPTSLINTLLNYGMGVRHAHCALTDCQLIAALFDRVAETPGQFEAILE